MGCEEDGCMHQQYSHQSNHTACRSLLSGIQSPQPQTPETSLTAIRSPQAAPDKFKHSCGKFTVLQPPSAGTTIWSIQSFLGWFFMLTHKLFYKTKSQERYLVSSKDYFWQLYQNSCHSLNLSLHESTFRKTVQMLEYQ